MFSALSDPPTAFDVEQRGGPVGDSVGDDEARAMQLNALWREALTMWLCWSDGQERLTAQMFAARSDARQVADLLDQMEQLRWRAVEMTRELLDSPLEAVENIAQRRSA